MFLQFKNSNTHLFNNLLGLVSGFLQSSFYHFTHTSRLKVMLTITLSELMSDVQVTQMKPDGFLEESGEAQRLRKSLEEMADEGKSAAMLKACGLPTDVLESLPENSADKRWSWSEVKHLSNCLLQAVDAGLEHALLVSKCCLFFTSKWSVSIINVAHHIQNLYFNQFIDMYIQLFIFRDNTRCIYW